MLQTVERRVNQGDSQTIQHAPSRLPLRGPRRYERSAIGSHLILHGYGLWLPNDPRGSGSAELRQEKLADLGAVHHGRKRVQPPREELRRFYRAAETRLDFPIIWFDDAKRQAMADAFARVVAARRYTVWECAILRNHAHLCVRRHRDDPVAIWRAFADASAGALRRFANVPADHPVFSNRPYRVFLKSPDDVRRVVAYIRNNPAREGLEPQSWAFVTPYGGWPDRRNPSR